MRRRARLRVRDSERIAKRSAQSQQYAEIVSSARKRVGAWMAEDRILKNKSGLAALRLQAGLSQSDLAGLVR